MPRHSDNRIALALSIQASGNIMEHELSCSRCRSSNRECIVSSSVSRCAHCARVGKSCDAKRFSLEELKKAQRARESVDKQLAEATKVMSETVAAAKLAAQQMESATKESEQISSKLNSAVAKVERLTKIRNSVVAKESILVRQGMRELDEEDGVNQSVPDFSDFSWEGVLDDPLIFSSGTLEVPSHNGSDSQ